MILDLLKKRKSVRDFIEKDVSEDMEDEIYTRLHMEEHQTKIPGTHMVLAALEHGLGSTWISYFNVDELSNILNLPKPYIASEIIAFGYPANNGNVTGKKGLNEIVFYNKFSKLV